MPSVYIGEDFGAEENKDKDYAENDKVHKDNDYLTSEEVTKQLEALRDYYIQEGQIAGDNLLIEASKKLAQAESKAEAIKKEAEAQANEIIQKAQTKASKIEEEARRNAYATGYDEGRTAGREKGYEDGYFDGRKQCAGALETLENASQDINRIKKDVAAQYESIMFEMIFQIANKITIDCFRDKEKTALKAMIKAKMREFTNTSKLRVTLAKADMSEDIDADLNTLRTVFSSNQDVEFEVLKEGEPGTLILDNGSEIKDASVSTQMKMIEELGKEKVLNN